MTRDDKPDKDDDIPVLRDIVRPGEESARAAPESAASDDHSPLSEEEIDAIASRIVERYSERLQTAIEQGIRNAIRVKQEPDRNPE